MVFKVPFCICCVCGSHLGKGGLLWRTVLSFGVYSQCWNSTLFQSLHPAVLIVRNLNPGKGKVISRTVYEGPEGKKRYRSTLSLTSAVDVVGGQRHTPAALPPGKTRYPLYRRLGEPQSRSGRVRKMSPPSGLDPRTFQPVANRYTDWAIPAP